MTWTAKYTKLDGGYQIRDAHHVIAIVDDETDAETIVEILNRQDATIDRLRGSVTRTGVTTRIHRP